MTTQSTYTYVPGEKLPAVKGTSSYKWDANDPIVVCPINVWIGWLPIVAANHGFNANKDSLFYQKYKFQVQLKLIDDPVAARDAYAAGESHVLWGTLDMMALFAPGLMKDSRTAPRIYQQIDWSNGGDGIVVRDSIKTVSDLAGKTIVYAQNSPSQYYLNTLLLSGGVQPKRVAHKYTKSAFEASAAFVADPTIDACVSWAPDIYNIVDKVPGTKLLSTTADASKVIADVLAWRADFARDNPQIVKGFTICVFDAMQRLKGDAEFKKQACSWMGKGYNFPEPDIEKMLNDAHSTNFAENREFFLNADNPTNFQKTWERINYVYGELGKLDGQVAFDQVMDFSVIKTIASAGMFADQKDTYTATFSKDSWNNTAEKPLLKNTVRINFYPNDHDPFHMVSMVDEKGKTVQKPYDTGVKKTLDNIATLAGQFDQCVISVVGHTDGSMRGMTYQEWMQPGHKDPLIPEAKVVELSQQRANAVVNALIERYKLPRDKFRAEGKGWSEPANPNDPDNDDANRRVEINIYPLENKK